MTAIRRAAAQPDAGGRCQCWPATILACSLDATTCRPSARGNDVVGSGWPAALAAHQPIEGVEVSARVARQNRAAVSMAARFSRTACSSDERVDAGPDGFRPTLDLGVDRRWLARRVRALGLLHLRNHRIASAGGQQCQAEAGGRGAEDPLIACHDRPGLAVARSFRDPLITGVAAPAGAAGRGAPLAQPCR